MNPLDHLHPESRAVAEKAKELFDNDIRFKFERLIPNAHNGVAMIVREQLGYGRERKLVVKIGTHSTRDSVQNERKWLNRLQWAEHTSNTVHLNNNPLDKIGEPYFVVEYLQHGTLDQFQTRIIYSGQILPNSILWAIFLCLVRGCIGMAWPPKAPPVWLERTQSEEPSRLAHADLHDENVVFGVLNSAQLVYAEDTVYLQEHHLIPPLKLIDFGEAYEKKIPDPIGLDSPLASYDGKLNLAAYRSTGRVNPATQKNILDVGVNMAKLIARQRQGSSKPCREWMQDPNVHPWLDPDLRLLVQRCLAIEPANRPTLDEFMMLIDNNVFSRTGAYYGDAGKPGGFESDDTIRYIVSRHILDADTP
ncbi:hypothetical protein F4677DRAFT_459362 [Hypoxylon crocopeplum]|nr:hypothetical protein F4677DRAFT_459362 [Hypoxylon crocopeplum]